MAKREVDKSKLYFGEKLPSWLNESNSLIFDEDIKEIVDFFLVHSPCKDVSSKGRPLKYYGWNDNTPKKGSYLYNRILESAELTNSHNLFTIDKREEERNAFENGITSNWNPLNSDRNLAVYINNGNLILDLFKHIRNSIAHSRFEKVSNENGNFLCFENGTQSADGFEIKARITLKIETMKQWIHIIIEESKTEHLKQTEEMNQFEKERYEEIKQKIIELIKNGQIKSKENLCALLGYEKKDIESVFKTLKDNVKYDNHRKCWEIIQKENS